MARERNKGPLRTEEILRLFREIMSACLAQEEPLKVGYLGPEGTFSQTATLKHFGHSVRALALPSVERGVPRGRGRARRFRRGAGGEFHRRLGQPHARHLVRLAAADLRRSGAAHPPVPHGRHGLAREDQAHLQPSAVAGAVPRLARRAPARRAAHSRVAAMPRPRAARATRTAPPPSPAKPPPMSTASNCWPPKSKTATTTPRGFL